MDYVARQFINLTKKFRKESRKALIELKDAIQKNTKAAEKAADAQEKQAHAETLILPAINAPRPQIHEYGTSEKSRHPMEWLKLGVSIATLLVVGAYTALSAFQLVELKISAEAAKRSAETGSKEFELSQRPWVSITDVTPASPLVFDNDGAHITIEFWHSNTEHSPAVDSFDQSDFLATYGYTPDPVKKREEFCNFAGARSEKVHGTKLKEYAQTWFPNQPIPMTMQISISTADIKKAMVEIPGNMIPGHPLPPVDFFAPTFIFCTAYRPTFTDAQYHTGYILKLIEIKTQKFPKFRQRGEIPPNELRFVYDPSYGVFAD
jgi:hypothetical protein